MAVNEDYLNWLLTNYLNSARLKLKECSGV